MSLRARLIAALLVLAAAGLVTLAAVTYAEQRSFLLDGVDKQTRDAQRAVSFELAGPGGLFPGIRRPPPVTRDGNGPPRPPAPPGEPDDGGGSGPQGLPRGTVGQIRNANGTVIESTAVRSYGADALPAPK